ncbi:MAG: YggS family pyridoxal phosphate-dependent enzyme [Syntrophomonadaceae bacterium]|nr:YggS family pyridoxal phosphate-dependent enzyme [Syntrophomonadaceae bacterium]
MKNLSTNLDKVRQHIVRAACKSGRNASDITLVAVSKTVDVDTVNAACKLGVNDFGENRAAELSRKKEFIPAVNWHMIGRLQTNKVKDVAGKACLIHSLDRWSLAQELDKRGNTIAQFIPVLLQINIAGEEQKAGITPEETADFLEDTSSQLSWVKIMGLMTVAPLFDDGEASRPIFRELYQLRTKFSDKIYKNVDLRYLSMGMSQDYEVAIEEGANIVRVGSAIFG